ncbi:MAG TPA: hypothetical protein VEH57_08185 [Thermoplasmata archaeon]|nr:hypothetical protein [Thermoplasmata archaeon]
MPSERGQLRRSNMLGRAPTRAPGAAPGCNSDCTKNSNTESHRNGSRVLAQCPWSLREHPARGPRQDYIGLASRPCYTVTGPSFPPSRRRSSVKIAIVLIIVFTTSIVVFLPAAPHSIPHSAPPAPVAPPPGLTAVDPQFIPKTLSPLDPATLGYFGTSVAISGNIAVVGAYGEAVNGLAGAGAAYIENLATGSVIRVTSPDPQVGGAFGVSVAVGGAIVLVGAPTENSWGNSGGGSAYLFSTGGSYLTNFTSPTDQAGGEFGDSVALGSGYALIGAPVESLSGCVQCGDAYLINLATASFQQIISPNPLASSAFGQTVAINNNLFAVGAPGDVTGGLASAGAVYVYSLPTGNPVERIANPLPNTNAYFGDSLAISGTVVVAGAPFDSLPPVANDGAAFEYNILTNATTTFGSPSPVADGWFGGSVAVNTENIVIGAPAETSGGQLRAGNAYLFSADSGELVSSAFAAPAWPFSGRFGAAVAQWGTTIVVGAPNENSSGLLQAGHAYVFNQIPLQVTSPNAASGGQLGASVAVGGGTMVIGAPYESTAGVGFADGGNTYVVPVDPAPGLPVITLSIPDPGSGAEFGYSVAADGNHIVVGAPGANVGGTMHQGRVYVFNDSPLALYREWTTPAPSANAYFGFSVALSGNLVAIGAPYATVGADTSAGQAFVYNIATGALVTTVESGYVQTSGFFGNSVSINGGQILVGAPGESIGGKANAGGAYLNSSSTGASIAQFVSPNVQAGGNFGFSVSLGGNSAVIGAPFETVGGHVSAGRVYVFSASTYALQFTLISSQLAPNEFFGWSVSTNGGTVVVGAPEDESVGFYDAGAIYVFNVGSGVILDRFYSPNPAVGEGFGSSVYDGPTRTIVGAPMEGNGHSLDTGAAYLFGYALASIL